MERLTAFFGLPSEFFGGNGPRSPLSRQVVKISQEVEKLVQQFKSLKSQVRWMRKLLE